jgi:hypothetical protein
MLNRSERISGRPYVRLTFKGNVNPTTSSDILRNKLISALQSSPHFILVGEPSRSVSSAFESSTTLGFGTVYFDATVRYNTNADGMTFDVTLRAFDCVVKDFLGACLVVLFDAVKIGTTYTSTAPLGTKTAQQLAEESGSPLDKLTKAATKPLEETSDLLKWIAAAAIVLGGAYLLKQGKPLLKSIGQVFKRGR